MTIIDNTAESTNCVSESADENNNWVSSKKATKRRSTKIILACAVLLFIVFLFNPAFVLPLKETKYFYKSYTIYTFHVFRFFVDFYLMGNLSNWTNRFAWFVRLVFANKQTGYQSL